MSNDRASAPPRVTVLMPVFNGTRYLAEAIDSILTQTFNDFELLIVDDGSTDDSRAIVEVCPDPRIRLVCNDGNRGLIYSLNRGISLARGEYIARMDADDICLPERLEQQVALLDADPDLAAVGTPVMFIDCAGTACGAWKDDRRTPGWPEIRRRLPRANCLAHPGMTVRRSIMTAYGYDPRRKGAEDYDLWLRMAANNLRISKTAQPLLLYRRNPTSITAATRRKNPDLQNARIKLGAALQNLIQGNLRSYWLTVAAAALPDLAYGLAKGLLRRAERLGIAWGRAIGRLLPLSNPSGLFFFFPFYHTGGAEKVHADIVSCFREERPWVFFTKRSKGSTFLERFRASARCFDIPWLLKYGYPFSAGILAGVINRHPEPRVFGCNALFFYLLLPHLAPHVRVVDLLHALGGGAEQFALPMLGRLDQRVVISAAVRDDLLKLYRGEGIDPTLDSRITVIANRVEVPAAMPEKPSCTPLQALFVGRGSEEKRVHLIGRAARHCREQGLAVQFTLIGDLDGWLAEEDRPCCFLTGLISDETELTRLYQQSHLILISSSREGFPLTLMEGMARGCVAVATAVGGIPEHIRHLENGWLLPAEDDDAVVAGICTAVRQLTQERHLLERLSSAAFDYAQRHFSGERFCDEYRNVFLR